METRLEEMRKQAQDFHDKHPDVWRMFKAYTISLINRGFKNYGAKSVMERIRWEKAYADENGINTFKINNNYTAFYARRFMTMYPLYEGFFRLREQISKDKEATGQSELTPEDYKYL